MHRPQLYMGRYAVEPLSLVDTIRTGKSVLILLRGVLISILDTKVTYGTRVSDSKCPDYKDVNVS